MKVELNTDKYSRDDYIEAISTMVISVRGKKNTEILRNILLGLLDGRQ